MTLQVHFYFQQSSQKDPKLLKLLVVGIWYVPHHLTFRGEVYIMINIYIYRMLDMTHLVGISIFVYHYVISNWGKLFILYFLRTMSLQAGIR